MSLISDTMTAAEFRALQRQNGDRCGIAPSGNRKVVNAAKTEQGGVVFASGLERHMHNLLHMHKIAFEFQKRYVLQAAFVYNGERIREITYTTDFWLPDYDTIIDTKGIQTQQGVVRIKLLKHELMLAGLSTCIFLPSTKDECAALVRDLLENRNNKNNLG